MPRTIEYFLTMASPWAYLGHNAFMDMAARHGATVAIKPMPIRRLFPETGGLPLPQRHPVRQRYRLVELRRWRDRRGLPLKPEPRHVPFDATLLDRAVIAAVAAGHDPDAFMRRAFAAIWDEERDLADAEVVAALAAASDLPPDLLDQARGEAAGAAYEAALQEALAKDVFGAPSYVLGGEVFWGQDRLELLEAALASGRAPMLPAARAQAG